MDIFVVLARISIWAIFLMLAVGGPIVTIRLTRLIMRNMKATGDLTREVAVQGRRLKALEEHHG